MPSLIFAAALVIGAFAGTMGTPTSPWLRPAGSARLRCSPPPMPPARSSARGGTVDLTVFPALTR